MTAVPSNRRVFLIGFMGAGKTSVGKALAQRLNWEFRDLDRVIEAREHKTVAQIFADSGETGFRKAECAALEDLLANSARGKWIIALGGGAFVQPRNRTALQQSGAITVLLEAPLHELKRRVSADGIARPLAQDEAKFAELFESRRAAYAAAQFRIETTGKRVDEVAAEIRELLSAVERPEVKQ